MIVTSNIKSEFLLVHVNDFNLSGHCGLGFAELLLFFSLSLQIFQLLLFLLVVKLLLFFHLIPLLVFLPVVLNKLVQLVLLELDEGGDDDSQDQVEHEEGAKDDDKSKVNGSNCWNICIHNVVEDGGPAISGDHIEDCQQGGANVVKVEDAVLDLHIVKDIIVLGVETEVLRIPTCLI